jgi:ubiquinone/menaquinone biosynthesis C-methylase UbiE
MENMKIQIVALKKEMFDKVANIFNTDQNEFYIPDLNTYVYLDEAINKWPDLTTFAEMSRSKEWIIQYDLINKHILVNRI